MAGGTTKIADDKEIYVIKANGAAVSRKGFKWLGASWDGTKYVYHPGGISSLTLDPGDTIVVPEQLERIEWLKTDQGYCHHHRQDRLDGRRSPGWPKMIGRSCKCAKV